jgi:hypothetical protein
MSSLISYGTGTQEPAPAPIVNNSFWPSVDPADFLSAERLDSTMTAERVEQALRAAMADINRQLADWQAEQEEAGAGTIDDVALPSWQVPNAYPNLYRRAVYATAHAALLERYRDYSATGDGADHGEVKDLAADDYRRDARWAVSEIMGRNHVTVELI